MCEICGSYGVRSYTHSRNAHHRKLLFARMRQRKNQSIALYGYYYWVAPTCRPLII